MVWTTIKRGLRHLFRLRWDMDLSIRKDACPCCFGIGAHWLLHPEIELKDPLVNGNTVNCAICQGMGVVVVSEHYAYATVRRGQCVTRR